MEKTIIAGLIMLCSLLSPVATVVDLDLNLSGDVAPARAIDINTTLNQTYNWSGSSPLFKGPTNAATRI